MVLDVGKRDMHQHKRIFGPIPVDAKHFVIRGECQLKWVRGIVHAQVLLRKSREILSIGNRSVYIRGV